MKLELNNDEINEAIVAYVNEMGIAVAGKTVSVALIAGRKNGNSAEVTIEATVNNPVANADNVTTITSEAKVTETSETVEEKTDAATDTDDDSLFAS